ncbi:MAG: hypothetical protein B7X28_09475 [Halothiobacillus sp. 13-55-253]|nr:MAG: hypothetical protein B7X28_09475 [Halothiobacillus sp. 13-55-253]
MSNEKDQHSSGATLPLVIIGYGDIARRVAERHPQHAITAFSRQVPFCPVTHRGHWASVAIDLDQMASTVDIPARAIWLYFAPPARSGESDSRVANWLAAVPDHQRPSAVIYASTTAVYGDQGGLYACDRLPLERIRAGAPVVCLEESPWSNRIHADDLANIYTRLIARVEQAEPVSGVFNISDNNPRPMTELYVNTAAHFDLPAPPCLPLADVLAQSSPMAREFLTESKRIDARAIQLALDWQPRYPDLATTLASCP